MSILVQTVRVFGFRGLNNIEVNLEPVTVLTGMNNTGKTSFLKAMQIALGNKNFLALDDFHISDDNTVDKIIVDIKIIALKDGKQDSVFSEEWETVFTDKRIGFDNSGNQIIPIRTVAAFDSLTGHFKCKQFVLQEWSSFQNEDDSFWYENENGTSANLNIDELTFIYTDAQRDLLEDIKSKNSFLGKMLSKINYSNEDVEAIEKLIEALNDKAVNSSDVLTNIEATLKGLDSAMDNTTNGVEISPFAKKVRDLNKGVSILYSDFSMEYHGMGTRSWSSLLTLKAFIDFLKITANEESTQFFPIIAIEEPEAHLHPNAQKKLYSQIASIAGQKIISTHSPYIAASAELNQIRNFYKQERKVFSGKIDTSEMSSEEIRKVKRQVINTRGELFFAKAIVFAEGETEEQALSVFASKYFESNLLELGINFVGVDGKGNYSPFVRLAKSLNIPWFIFSDSDGNTVDEVKSQLLKIGIDNYDNIVCLDANNDFEKQIIADGYQDEIKSAILECVLPIDPNPQHEAAKKAEIAGYSNETLYTTLTGSKAQYGLLVSEQIIKSGKDLPQCTISLFDKIKATLN